MHLFSQCSLGVSNNYAECPLVAQARISLNCWKSISNEDPMLIATIKKIMKVTNVIELIERETIW